MNKRSTNKINAHYTLWYFFIFSILGLIMEMLFCYITTGVIESRKGFILLPVCPIYGIGAVIIIFILQYFKQGTKELLIVSVIAGSIIEYVLSFVLEAMYGNRFWDYGHLTNNLNGRICLQYCFYWMIAGLLIMKGIKPRIDKFIERIPKNKIKVANWILFSFLLFDALVTVWGIHVYTTRVTQKYYNTYVEVKLEEDASIFSKMKYEIEEKAFSDEIINFIFPNIRIRGEKGEEIFARGVLKSWEENK